MLEYNDDEDELDDDSEEYYNSLSEGSWGTSVVGDWSDLS